MLLLSIVLGTGIAGLGSVLFAALISPSASSKFAPDISSVPTFSQQGFVS